MVADLQNTGDPDRTRNRRYYAKAECKAGGAGLGVALEKQGVPYGGTVQYVNTRVFCPSPLVVDGGEV